MSDVSPAAAPLWSAAGASVIGAAHARAGKPKQDALGWRPAQGRSVALAVADGHGSPKCFRSERGSQFAVDVTLSLLGRLMEGAGGDTEIARLRAQVKEALPPEIVAQWRRLVEADLAREPITPEEWATLAARDGEAATQPVRDDPFLAYGTTLLAAAATPRFLVVLQNGDGDILSVSREGTVARPLPGDSRLIANETTSLCSPDAVQNFRSAFHEMTATPPSLIILSTDGYANSFQDEAGFLQVGGDLLALIAAHGLGQVTANLEDWLGHASKEGSGDDVTLGLLALQAIGDAPPPARPAAQAKALASVGGGAVFGGPVTDPPQPVLPAAPEQVVRPPTNAVSLPQSVSAAQSAPRMQSVPLAHSVPQSVPMPQAAPRPNASPTGSIFAALGVLLLALLLLTAVVLLRKHQHTVTAAHPERHHATGAAARTLDLGAVQAGTTVALTVPQPESRRYTLHPAHRGLSLTTQGGGLGLVISPDRRRGPFRAELWYPLGGNQHGVIFIAGTVTPAGSAAAPTETAPAPAPGTQTPSDPTAAGGKSAPPPVDHRQ